jgi:hypothetical protein
MRTGATGIFRPLSGCPRGASLHPMTRRIVPHRGILLVERTPRTQEVAREVIAEVRRSEVDGIVTSPSGMALNIIPGAILETALRQQVPTMFNAGPWHQGSPAGLERREGGS